MRSKLEFEWGDALGAGGFGTVHKVVHKSNAKMYACKVIDMNALPNKDIQNEIRAIERVCRVGHRNIVEVFSISKETWEKGPVCLIQMELCDGDMHSYIEQRYQTGDPLAFSEIADIMIQVLNGLIFLHDRNEVHRDLKPRNVLYVNHWTFESQNCKQIWKITDFGYTTKQATEKEVFSSEGRMTDGYCAPELLLDGRYSKKVDIWGLGCIIFELATGRRAFPDNHQIRLYFWQGKKAQTPRVPPVANSKISDLNGILSDCLAVDERSRPDARSILYRFTQLLKSGDMDPKSVNGRESALSLEPLNPLDTAYTVNDHATLCLKQGKFVEAKRLFQWALELQEKETGRSHTNVARTLSGLGTACSQLAQYTDAESTVQEALEIYRNALGQESLDVARSISALANIFRLQGRYRDAEEQYKVAVSLFEKIGPGQPDMAGTLFDLGSLYGILCRYEQEYKMFDAAVRLRKKVFGDEHPETATAMSGLGKAKGHQGFHDLSELIHQWAVSVHKKLLGDEHPSTLTSRANLGVSFLALGRAAEAEQEHQVVLEFRLKTLRKDHPDIAEILQNLALDCRYQGQHEREERLLRQALEIHEGALGAEHPRTATTLADLGSALVSLRRFKQAESILKAAITILRNTWTDHPYIGKALSELGSAVGSQGRHKEEEGLQMEALEMLSKTLGPTHPDTARAIFNLGVNSENQKNHIEALKRYWEALHIWQKNLAKGHRNVTLAEGRIQALERPKGKWRRIFTGLH